MRGGDRVVVEWDMVLVDLSTLDLLSAGFATTLTAWRMAHGGRRVKRLSLCDLCTEKLQGGVKRSVCQVFIRALLSRKGFVACRHVHVNMEVKRDDREYGRRWSGPIWNKHT